MVLRAQDIRAAVQILRQTNVGPVGNFYFGIMTMKALVGLILTYKRPRSSGLYRKSTRAAAYVDEVLEYKRPRSTKLYRSLL